ncbi:MAG TPA: hypothetical protein VJ806_05395 [Luteimonas sp.]|nr:hypothetical protein [Luteimonas sp.]
MTWRKLVSAFAAIALVSLIGLGGYIVYLWATYIDKAIDTGQAYGLSIGDTKQSTFKKLPLAFDHIGDGNGIFVEVRADDATAAKLGIASGRHIMVPPRLDRSDFDTLSTSDQWIFYVSPSHRDFLRLSFCGEKLCRIYRHRKYFELP